jgi:hypothetical protein
MFKCVVDDVAFIKARISKIDRDRLERDDDVKYARMRKTASILRPSQIFFKLTTVLVVKYEI